MKTSLPVKHSAGVEFFRLPDLQSLDPEKYFQCLKILRPLFKDSDFMVSTPGFYINFIANQPDDGLVSLRLTYYTTDPAKTQEAINKFVDKNHEKIALFNSQWTGRASSSQPLETYEEEELRFRNFLNANTQIALDVLENFGELPFRELVHKYRQQQLPQKIRPEFIFESVFSKHSNFFQELKKDSLEARYWEDLVRAFHGQHPGLHFLVNMLIVPEGQYYLASPQSLL